MTQLIISLRSAQITLALVLVMMLQASPAQSSDDGTSANAHKNNGHPAHASGIRAHRNPATGKIGPPAIDFQPPGLSIAEQRMVNRSGKGLRQRTLPNGAVELDLQGRFRSMAIATTDTDGKAEVNCLHTAPEANSLLQGNSDLQTD